MKSQKLTLLEFDTKARISRAYLAGVIVGDGWCTEKSIGLHVKDKDFADAFVDAIYYGFGIKIIANYEKDNRNNKSYWRVRKCNQSGKFDDLIHFEVKTDLERRMWLRGFFDSEGNVQLRKTKMSKNSHNRRISFFNTNYDILLKSREFLNILGIKSEINSTKNTNGHLGSKTVFDLRLNGSKYNYSLFADIIGSSIGRKNILLKQLSESYIDTSVYCRAGQANGAETKRKNHKIIFPRVLGDIKMMIARGIKPTEKNCGINIKDYYKMLYVYDHKEIIKMILDGK